MKKRTLGMLTAAAAAVASVVLIASAATAAAPAAPPTPTTPYPTVAVNAKVCLVEGASLTKAQTNYNAALATYTRAVKAYNAGAGSLLDLLNAQQAVDTATIALNDANYAQATCQNKAVMPPPATANCVTLTLEFNRLTDDLVPTQDIEAVTKALYNMALANFNAGVGSQSELDAAKQAYDNAQAQTKLVQAQIAVALKAATDAKDPKCENINRPAPGGGGPGGSPSPAPSSPAPSGGPSSAPPGSPAPTASGTSS